MILTIDAHSVEVLAINGNYYFRLSDRGGLAGVATPPGQIDVVVRELLAECQRQVDGGSLMKRLTVKATLSSCVCADCEAGLAKTVIFNFRDEHGRALTISISIDLRESYGNTFSIVTDTPDGRSESITIPLPYAASDIFSALVAQKLEGDG